MQQNLRPNHRSRSRSSTRPRRAAFTLVELLAVIGIIAVLASVAFTLSLAVRKKAERVQCGENLKTLHTALSTYLYDNKRWPQVAGGDDEEEYWQRWAAVLEPYKLPDKVWMCPTHKRVTKDELLQYSSYHPMPFDGISIHTPHKWKNMPWVMEIGDNHGDGALMVMPDGSIQTAEYNVDKPISTTPRR